MPAFPTHSGRTHLHPPVSLIDAFSGRAAPLVFSRIQRGCDPFDYGSICTIYRYIIFYLITQVCVIVEISHGGLIDIMPKSYRIMLIFSLVLILVGSLLPWGCWGDLITICTTGIAISFENGFQFENNGGIFTICLSLLIVGLIFYNPRFIRNSFLWALISAIILFVYTIINIGAWVMKGIQQNGIIGASMPAIGSGVILVGSIALLFLTIQSLLKVNS